VVYNLSDTKVNLKKNMKTKSSYITKDRAAEISARIKESRDKLGWSQSEMSRAIDATRGACSHWENKNAHKMTLENAMRLCSQLGISLDFLTTGREGSGVLDKECLTKAVSAAERLAPRANIKQKVNLMDIAYAFCTEDKELEDSIMLKIVSLESR